MADTSPGLNILNQKELWELAKDSSVEGRMHLARAVSGFFGNEKLGHHERELAADILLNLVKQAEADLRQVLAEQLALDPNIPPSVMIYLANQDITIARQVLMHSPMLKEVDLLYIISARTRDHSRAIARRPSLTPVVTDKLIDIGDTETVRALVENQSVHLQKGSLKKLMKAALTAEDLQAPLMRRPEIDNELAIDLYMVVSQALRKELTTRFHIPASVIDQAAEGMIHELSREARGLRVVTEDMVAMARKFHEKNAITADLMIKTLRRGQVGFFLALLAVKADLSPAHLSLLLEKEGGKHLVVPCRHIGMMKSEFASIMLLSRGVAARDRGIDQRDLAQALRAFDTVKEYDVHRIMRSWRQSPEAMA